MDRIENHLDNFRNDIDQYQVEYQKLMTAHQQLQADMESMKNDWEGQAFDATLDSFLTDQKKADQMMESLRTMLDNLHYADDQYTACENNVSGIVNSIQV